MTVETVPSTSPTNGPPAATRPRRSWIERAVPWGLLCATSAGSCSRWSWLFDLCSHFRWYYFVSAALVGAITWRRQSRAAQIALCVTLLENGCLLAPYYLPYRQPSATEPGATVSIISLNVFTANLNKQAVLDYLRQRQADFVVVMEVDQRWEQALAGLRDLYPHQLMQSRSDNFGIGLLSREPLPDARFVDAGGTRVPTITALIERDGHPFLLIATHPLPPIGAEYTRERNAQLYAVGDFAKQSPIPSLIVGDLNATPWSFPFQDLIARSGLRDSALGRGISGSWNAKNPLIRIPIDHLLVPKNATVVNRQLGPDCGSDHFPIEATVIIR